MVAATANYYTPGLVVVAAGTAYNLQADTPDDVTVIWNAADTAAKTLTLPEPTKYILGKRIIIKDRIGNAATYNITLSVRDGSTIDGATTLVMNTNFQCVVLENDGTGNYSIINTGSGGGGVSSFDQLSGGTNTAAAMVVGSGASFATSGTGTIAGTPLVVSVSGTTKTLAIGDKNTTQDCNNASTQNITIPTNASVAFDINSVIVFEQNGAGVVAIAGAGGVTLNTPTGATYSTTAQYSAFYIRKEAINTWNLYPGTAASGTVNSGTSGQLAYYASTGTAISGVNTGSTIIVSGGVANFNYGQIYAVAKSNFIF